jgi:class 3 adenylate cyclase
MSAASKKHTRRPYLRSPAHPDRCLRLGPRVEQFGSMEIEQLDGSADLAAARDALEEHRWQEAFDLLARADREGRLGATDLEALAQAAWFNAQPDVAVEAKERAFKAYVAQGNKARAAAMAFDLSREWLVPACSRRRLRLRSLRTPWRLREPPPRSSARSALPSIRRRFGRACRTVGAGCSWPKATLRVRRGSCRRDWPVAGRGRAVRDRPGPRTSGQSAVPADEADLELQAAREEFRRMAAVLRAAAERQAAPTITYKTFIFTDIVASTNLAEAMGDEAWEHLLRWHDDTLRALFVNHGGEVVNSTGDGFFVAFDSASSAIACAKAVQQTLAEQRRTHGFAPAVRIGVHSAAATRRASDYSGKGVHVAARIAALALGGEIVASAATAALAGSPALAEPRAVSLKGVSGEVDVVSVAWD